MKRVNYQELLAEYGSSDGIPYSEFLRTWEWSKKKHLIEVRDSNQCQQCGEEETQYDYGTHFWPKKARREDFIHPITGKEGILYRVMTSEKAYVLHCHHKYYISETLPWEYPDEALVTLCMYCHSEFHKTNKVPFYRKSDMEFLDYTPCPRCCGAGVLSEYSYHMSGVCFQCGGARYLELIK